MCEKYVKITRVRCLKTTRVTFTREVSMTFLLGNIQICLMKAGTGFFILSVTIPMTHPYSNIMPMNLL